MSSKNPLGQAPSFGFWPFNWDFNWYHPNGGWNKYFIHTFEFVNLLPIKIYQYYFRDKTDADQCYLLILK